MPQIKSPALAQTTLNMHQIGLSSNTSHPNRESKKVPAAASFSIVISQILFSIRWFESILIILSLFD